METVTRLTPIKAIRAKCMNYCCWSKQEVKLCPTKDCPLYPYRMGRNPYIVRGAKNEYRDDDFDGGEDGQ